MNILEKPLWRDYSRHQGQVNFDAAVENGVLGMAARSTISWGYQDSWFPRNWKEAGRVGIYRTSYHVIYPDQPIDDQLDNWYSVHPKIDIIPRVIDIELDRDQESYVIANAVKEMSKKILERDGVRPWLYIGYYNIVDWLYPHVTEEWLNEHYWWIPHYGTDRSKEQESLKIPSEINTDRVILHQTADKKPSTNGETESTFVDWDRWQLGNEDQMHDWIQENYGDQISLTCEEKLVKLQEEINQLREERDNYHTQLITCKNIKADLENELESMKSNPWEHYELEIGSDHSESNLNNDKYTVTYNSSLLLKHKGS